MSALVRSRPTARGAALRFLAGLVGFAFPFVTHATTLAPTGPAAAHADNVLTLYSEPGLRGRHATYRNAAHDVEHQGFVAQSAASTGMWTLCEGGEVASRCQTVEGEARELKLSPQIVRPGLNALALYDQPGLKGSKVIYSFAADRPAPFHARSARTWGGPWALCDRGYKHCQALDGTTKNLDLVVAAVRPAPEAADTDTDAAPIAEPIAAKAPVARRHSPQSTPVASHPRPVKAPAPLRPRLVHVAVSHPKPVRPAPKPVRVMHAWRPSHLVHAPVFTPVRERPKARHSEVSRRLHEARPVRFERSFRRPTHLRLVHEIADSHARHAHTVRHRLYRHVRLAWGDGDPYLYRYAPGPAFWDASPRW